MKQATRAATIAAIAAIAPQSAKASTRLRSSKARASLAKCESGQQVRGLHWGDHVASAGAQLQECQSEIDLGGLAAAKSGARVVDAAAPKGALRVLNVGAVAPKSGAGGTNLFVLLRAPSDAPNSQLGRLTGAAAEAFITPAPSRSNPALPLGLTLGYVCPGDQVCRGSVGGRSEFGWTWPHAARSCTNMNMVRSRPARDRKHRPLHVELCRWNRCASKS